MFSMKDQLNSVCLAQHFAYALVYTLNPQTTASNNNKQSHTNG